MPFQPLRPAPTRKHDKDVAFAAVRSLFPPTLVALALCLASLSLASCDSDDDAATTCQGDVGKDCPATYDDALTAPLTCQDRETISVGHCMTDGPLTLMRSWGTHQSNCFYDSATRMLIGANMVNDTKTFCDGTSAMMSSGNVPEPAQPYCLISGSERTIDCSTSQP